MARTNRIGPIIGAVVGIAIAVFGKHFFSGSTEGINNELITAAEEVNVTCPFMVDEVTRIDNAEALPDNAFQYNYTLVGVTVDSVDVAYFEDFMTPQIINQLRFDPDMKWFRDQGVTMVYSYKDMHGVFLTRLEFNKDQYSE